MKRPVLTCFLVVVLLAAVGHYFLSASSNPYAGVDWIRDYPGAGDRYVTFSPVLASDHGVALGPSIGADYGELYFKDLNHDGVKEAIVESNPWLTLEEFHPSREVLEYRKGAGERVEFVRSERLSKD